MKKVYFLGVFSCFLVFLFSCSNAQEAFALGNLQDAFNAPLNTAAQESGYNTDTKEIGPIVARVINAAVGLIGIILLSLLVYGGFLWMSARGEEEKVQTAGKVIRAAIIGAIILAGSYAIAYAVFKLLG